MTREQASKIISISGKLGFTQTLMSMYRYDEHGNKIPVDDNMRRSAKVVKYNGSDYVASWKKYSKTCTIEKVINEKEYEVVYQGEYDEVRE